LNLYYFQFLTTFNHKQQIAVLSDFDIAPLPSYWKAIYRRLLDHFCWPLVAANWGHYQIILSIIFNKDMEGRLRLIEP
jgi:hypothetical protein